MSSPRLYEHYKSAVRDQLKEVFNYKNPSQIPRLEKIVLNMGVGEATQDRKENRRRRGRHDPDFRPEAPDDPRDPV